MFPLWEVMARLRTLVIGVPFSRLREWVKSINSFTLIIRVTKGKPLMRSKSFEGMACSIAGALDTIGDRWGMLILRDLMFRLSRYEDLRRSTGVTHATLSDRLKHLEANGLIMRRRYQKKPNRYEYILTPKGRHTVLLAHALVQVGDRWQVAGKKGPPLRFVDRNTGSAVKLALIDADKGIPVKLADVIPVEGPGADDLMRWRITHFQDRDVS